MPVPDGLDDPAAATSYIQSFDCMGIDEIRSQSQGSRLAPTDGGCIQCRKVGASIGAAVSIQDNQRHPAARAGTSYATSEAMRSSAQPTRIRARLQELTAGKGVERAIDCVAGELGAEIARNLAPAGTMLVFGALSSHRQTDPGKFTMPLFAPRLIYSTATVRGWWSPRWVAPSRSLKCGQRRAISTMLSNGALTPPTIVRYSFKDFQEAVRLADGETGQQKVLLDLSERAP